MTDASTIKYVDAVIGDDLQSILNTHNGSAVEFTRCKIDAFNIVGIEHGSHLRFYQCELTGRSSIADGSIFGELRFEKCVFKNEFHIENVMLGGLSYFDRCKFMDDTHFGGSRFSQAVTFNENDFYRYFSIRDCQYLQYCWFINCNFRGYFNQIRSEYQSEVFFSNCNFSQVNTFDNSKFKRPVEMKECRFARAPTFYGTEFGEGFFLSQCSFSDLRSADAASGYRQLAKIFSDQMRRRDEAKFYVMEQDVLLRRESSFLEKLVIIIYRAASNYGTSVTKPVMAFMFGNSVSFLYYVAHFRNLTVASEYALKQVFSPFAVWHVADSTAGSIGLRLVSSFQSMTVLVSVLLLGLALGWRFKKY